MQCRLDAGVKVKSKSATVYDVQKFTIAGGAVGIEYNNRNGESRRYMPACITGSHHRIRAAVTIAAAAPPRQGAHKRLEHFGHARKGKSIRSRGRKWRRRCRRHNTAIIGSARIYFAMNADARHGGGTSSRIRWGNLLRIVVDFRRRRFRRQ